MIGDIEIGDIEILLKCKTLWLSTDEIFKKQHR